MAGALQGAWPQGFRCASTQELKLEMYCTLCCRLVPTQAAVLVVERLDPLAMASLKDALWIFGNDPVAEVMLEVEPTYSEDSKSCWPE